MSISNAKPKQKPKSRKKIKVAKNFIAYVHINFKDNANYKSMKIENEKDLKSVEKYLLKHLRAWKWASLKDINTKAVYHYYHPTTGVERLNLETYKEQFTAYSLYIIPTSSYKRKMGIIKGKSQRIYDLDQIHQYWNKDVLRIDVYVEGKKINSYENGRFLK
jgi:ABC-type bacteriocin/lantibiotic exporter with double-glycine peptidase domain